MNKHNAKRFLQPKLMTLAVASCFVADAALANPSGGTVVHGAASIQQSGTLLTVTNSPSTIINWQSFSIGASEITRFIQQSAASAVLNRVTTQNPSAILGALQSNGRVFLINPNGIAFGASAQIDVAGLVASTLALSNEDFLAGRMRFTEVPGAGSITNDGAIRTASGGSVYLVGADVANSGVITSPQGEVVLAAGKSVELVNPATPNLRVQVAAADNEARNLGTIVSDAGRVGIYAGLVTQGGTVQANSAVSEGGRIVLKATNTTMLEDGSVTTATGATGGTVQALGDKVGMVGSATIDASGTSGGGTVLVGGDFQGKNPDVQNATRTYVGADTTIRADATENGDGGKVIVWSDEATRAYGTISAKGGPQGGDGGFVEVSGKQQLDYQGVTNTSAANGRTGTLLLDPEDVQVGAASDNFGSGGAFSGGIFTSAGDANPSTITWATVDTNLAENNLFITTQSAFGEQPGDITVVSSHTYTSANRLALLANSNITVNDNVTVVNNGSGSIEMYAGWSGSTAGLPTDPLSIPVNSNVGDIVFGANAGIQTGGSVFLHAGNQIALGLGATIVGGSNPALHFVELEANSMALANAGGITGANIILVPHDFFRDIQLGVSTAGSLSLTQEDLAGSLSLTQEDLNTLTLSDPATGLLEIGEEFSGSVHLAGPIAFNPAKVQNLRLNASGSITQASTAPLTVTNLHADSNFGSVLLDSADNNVSLLVGSSFNGDFKFRNAGSLLVGSMPSTQLPHDGISADGGEGGEGGRSASVEITVNSGNLTVSQSIFATGGSGSSGGDATVSLNAPAGQVLVNNGAQVAAFGGFNFSPNGGNATTSLSGASVTVDGAETTVQATGGGVSGVATGGAASTSLTATSGPVQVTNGALVSANGGSGGSDGGSAIVTLTGPSITVNSSTVSAAGGGGSSGGDATVVLNASSGNVSLASTISATGGDPVEGFKGGATVSISSTNGNVTTGANIIADGAEGSISISALDGFIQQTDPAGFLKAVPSGTFLFGFGTVNLTAKNGIGTIANPVRIDNTGDPDVKVQNLGTTGDIAVSFFNQAFNETCGASIHLCIDGDFIGTFNNNPTGTYYVRSETGDLRLDIAFTPVDQPLLPGQSVHLAAPSNSVILTGAATGSIAAGASGSVTLEAGDLLNLQGGSSVSGGNVLLKADNMDIFGTVTATPGVTTILPFTASRPIKLGPTLQSTSELMLSQAELEKILGGAMVIGSQSGGLLTFESAINTTALSSSLEVRGSSVVQAPGAAITGPLAAFGVNAVNLADASNQISSFTGGTQGAGAAVGVFTQSALQIGSITTQNGPVIVTADGNISFGSGGSGVNAGTGSATLTSTGGAMLDGHAGVDIVANQALLTAASGIGSFVDPIEIQVAGVSLTSTAGEVGVINTGNLVLNGLAFSGSTASIEASGLLTLGSSTSVAGTSNVGLRGAGGLTVDQGINASNGNITLESGAGADVAFTGAGGVNTLGGGIAITAGRDIIYGSSSQINSSSGNIVLTAGNDVVFNTQRINTSSGGIQINAGRDFVHNSTDGHNTSSGSFTINAVRDLIFSSGRINTSGGAMLLQAGNNLTYNGSSNLNTLSGNITIAAGMDMSFTNYINSSSGAILLTAGRNIDYSASNKINTSTGNIGASAGGNATFVNGGINTFSGAIIVATGGSLSLLAAASPVEFRSTGSGTTQSYTVGGNVVLQGGSASGARAEIQGSGSGTTQTFNVTGNVNLTGGTGPSAYARIFNDPDVNMTVGGAVNLQAGSGTGSFATIEAGSIETINLTFPTLSSGGYFVNGVENAVFDSATSTGFLVDRQPAVLDVNFFATYSGGTTTTTTTTVPQSVNQAIDQVVNATNQQASLPQQQTGGQAATSDDEDEKKSPPICS